MVVYTIYNRKAVLVFIFELLFQKKIRFSWSIYFEGLKIKNSFTFLNN